MVFKTVISNFITAEGNRFFSSEKPIKNPSMIHDNVYIVWLEEQRLAEDFCFIYLFLSFFCHLLECRSGA